MYTINLFSSKYSSYYFSKFNKITNLYYESPYLKNVYKNYCFFLCILSIYLVASMVFIFFIFFLYILSILSYIFTFIIVFLFSRASNSNQNCYCFFYLNLVYRQYKIANTSGILSVVWYKPYFCIRKIK